MADHNGLQVEYQLRVAGKLLVLDLQEGVVHMIQGLVVLLAVVVACSKVYKTYFFTFVEAIISFPLLHRDKNSNGPWHCGP